MSEVFEPSLTQDMIDYMKIKATYDPERLDGIDVSLAAKVSQADLPYKTVESFGAVGDGTTDDTTAISNALNSNYNIIFGKKTYYCPNRITVTVGNKIIDGNGATILYKGSESSSIGNTAVLTFSNVDHLTLSNLIVNVNSNWIARPYLWDTTNYNNYLTLRGNTCDAISFLTCNNIRLNKCISTKGKTGYFIADSYKVSLTDCISEYTLADGIFITGSSHNVSVEGHHCDNVGDDCYSADGYDWSVPDNNPHFIVFSNCTAVDSFGALVCLQGSHDTKAIGCSGTNHKYTPLKLGRLKNGSNVVSGYNQYIIGCHVTCNDTIEGTSNGSLPSKSGTMFNGDSTPYQSNNHDLYIIDSIIQKSDTVYYELFFQYCQNVGIINTTFTGFNVIPNYVNNIKISGNNLYMQSAVVPSNSSYVSIINNYILNKAVSNVRGTDVIALSECNNVKILNNNLVNNNTGSNHNIDIYSSQAQDSFIIDDPNVGTTSTTITNLGCNGVFNNVNNIPVARFKNGQLIYNPSNNVLSINKNGTLTTVI